MVSATVVYIFDSLHNHALPVVHHRPCWCRRHQHLCTPLLATGLDIETSYLV